MSHNIDMNEYRATERANARIMVNEYRAIERANARMMDTTIWQAMRITGMSDKEYRTSEIFHKLFLLYLDEERANN